MKKTGLILSIGALLSITGCNNNANKTFEITWEVNGDVVQACFWAIKKDQIRKVWRLQKGKKVQLIKNSTQPK